MNNVLKLTEADLASVKNGTPILVDVWDDVLHDLTFQEVKDALIEVFECDWRTLKIDEDETWGESYSLLISWLLHRRII